MGEFNVAHTQTHTYSHSPALYGFCPQWPKTNNAISWLTHLGWALWYIAAGARGSGGTAASCHWHFAALAACPLRHLLPCRMYSSPAIAANDQKVRGHGSKVDLQVGPKKFRVNGSLPQEIYLRGRAFITINLVAYFGMNFSPTKYSLYKVHCFADFKISCKRISY